MSRGRFFGKEAVSGALTLVLLLSILSTPNEAFQVSFELNKSEYASGETVVFEAFVNATGGFFGGEAVKDEWVKIRIVGPGGFDETRYLNFSQYLGGMAGYGFGYAYNYSFWGESHGYAFGYGRYGQLFFNGSFSPSVSGTYTVFLYVNDDIYASENFYYDAPPLVKINSPPQFPEPVLEDFLDVNVSIDGTGSELEEAKLRLLNDSWTGNWESFLNESGCDSSGATCVVRVLGNEAPLGNVTIQFSAKDAFGLWNNSTSLNVSSQEAMIFNELEVEKASAPNTGNENISLLFNLTLKGGTGVRIRMSDLSSGSASYDPDGMVFVWSTNSSGVNETYWVKNDYDETQNALRPRDEDPSTPWVDAKVFFVLMVPAGMTPGTYEATYSIGLYE